MFVLLGTNETEMEERCISQHSEYCRIQTEKNKQYSAHYNCVGSVVKTVLLVNNQFYLLTYNSCIVPVREIDFYQEIINNAVGKSKVTANYMTFRTELDKELKDFRITGKKLKTHTMQVHYIYEDAARKQYAIVTQENYLQAIANNDILLANAITALESNHYNMWGDTIKELFNANYFIVNQKEIHATVDALIDQIKKSVKNKN